MLSGLLVSKDYSYTLLDPRDLRDFTGLSTNVVTQRQKMVLNVGWELVRWHLEGMFGKVEEGVGRDGVPTIRVSADVVGMSMDGLTGAQVMGAVDVKQAGEHELVLEWDSSASNDMIADSTLALITGIDHSPASVKRKHYFALSLSDTIRSSTCRDSNDALALTLTLALARRTPTRGRRGRGRPGYAHSPARDVPRGALWRRRAPHAR